MTISQRRIRNRNSFMLNDSHMKKHLTSIITCRHHPTPPDADAKEEAGDSKDWHFNGEGKGGSLRISVGSNRTVVADAGEIPPPLA